jgi:catechol 2,3-dioxygenase-like lactoylglutathione lyase family enzyme
MPIALNHTIVWCRDQQRSAEFLTDLFGLPGATPWGPFRIVGLANGVSLDYHETDGEVAPQHYAFLVGEAEFDAIFGRILGRGLDHWADPMQHRRRRSATTTADRASTSRIPTGTRLRSSPGYGSGGAWSAALFLHGTDFLGELAWAPSDGGIRIWTSRTTPRPGRRGHPQRPGAQGHQDRASPRRRGPRPGVDRHRDLRRRRVMILEHASGAKPAPPRPQPGRGRDISTGWRRSPTVFLTNKMPTSRS